MASEKATLTLDRATLGHLRPHHLDRPGLTTEVALGAKAGLAHESVANFDNLFLLSRTRLVRRLGRASSASMAEACTAAAVALGCAGELA